MDLDTLYLSKGIGALSFGATRSDVIGALGEDFEEHVDDAGDVELEYKHLGLRFDLWKEFGFRLGSVASERETLSLCGARLFGKTKEEVRRFVEEELEGTVSEEDGCVHDDGSIQEWIAVDDENVIFWFDRGVLYLVDVMSDWDDDDTPSWARAHEEPPRRE